MTKNLVVLAISSASVAFAESAPQIDVLNATSSGGDTKLHHMIQYFVFGLKGSIVGFQQGLLNDERIRLSDQCFGSDEINADLIFMSDFAARKKSIWDAYKFTVLGSDMLINEMDNCNWTSTV